MQAGRTCSSCWAGVYIFLVPVGVPVTLGVGKDAVASIVIVSMSQDLSLAPPQLANAVSFL